MFGIVEAMLKFLAIIAVLSCVNGENVFNYLQGNSNYSVLAELLVHANLSATLSTGGKFTSIFYILLNTVTS